MSIEFRRGAVVLVASSNQSGDCAQVVVFASAVPHLAGAWERLRSIGEDVIVLIEGGAHGDPPFGTTRLGLWQTDQDRDHPTLHGHGLFCRAILDLAEQTDANYFWFVHHDVLLDGDWSHFFESFSGCNADFLAPCIRSRTMEPDWYWWRILAAPDEAGLPPADRQLAALSPLFRISKEGLAVVRKGLEEGWQGHCEATFPTLISLAGLLVEDIGGRGSWTPAERWDQHYTSETFRPTSPKSYRPGLLHYPVPLPRVTPLRVRIATPSKSAPRLLFFSPVGRTAEPLLPQLTDRFRAAGSEFVLARYEDSIIPEAPDIRIVNDRGQKWQLARRHLDPESLQDFDFVFIWDDDIGIGDFDPVRFVRIMESNRLAMAQPSIRSPHRIHYPITAQKACPPPLGKYRRVGRLTNFVEIMVPVFSRDAWREMHACLDDRFQLGWGLDYLPLGNKGVVDCMHVVHTRPCNYHGEAANEELKAFLASQALRYYEHIEMGHLLEAIDLTP